MQQVRRFVFTDFDTSKEEEERLASLARSSSCAFVGYGREVCPSTGRPHLQGGFDDANDPCNCLY